jgi:hypothetical protein
MGTVISDRVVSPSFLSLETIMTASNTPAVASASTPAASKYFDLHTYALGYIDDIRSIPVKRGSFLACRLSALRNEDVDQTTTRFDLKVVGAHAKACVEAMKPLTDTGKVVIAQMKIGDVYPEVFSYKSGKRAGEMGVNIKGRVLKVYMAKVDGQDIDLPPMPYNAETPSKQPPVGLITTGVGYLNSIRKVNLGEGDYVWMANIAALRGDPVEGGKVETTRFDLVILPVALGSALTLQDSVLAKKKVLVKFDASAIHAELFQYRSGDKAGQTDAVLKGSLQSVSWAKVDGEQFPLAEKAA